eukprot:gene7175-14618_t
MSAEEGNPSWLSESPAQGTHAPPNAPTTDSSSRQAEKLGTNADGSVPRYKSTVKVSLLILNVGVAVMMSATGALGVENASSVSDTGNVFVGIYMCLFAAILATFEIVQIRPCGAIDEFYKKNFGFLYGTIGKGLYIFFIAILSFGLTYPKELSLATGIVVSFVGLGQIALYMKYPQFFDVKEKYQP